MAIKEEHKKWILFCAMFIFFVLAYTVARSSSAVADEVGGHLTCGYLYWQSGEYSGGINNFPLGQLIMAFPLWLSGDNYELFSEEHLLLFRMPAIAMGILLVYLVYCLTRQLFDEETALLAALLCCCSPNLVTHFSLACLDGPLAFFCLATICALSAYLSAPSTLKALALGLALGCALSTKIQAFLLLPIIIIALVVVALGKREESSSFPYSPLHLAIVLLLPFVIINVSYLHMPSSDALFPPLYVKAFEGKLSHGLSKAQPGYCFGEYSHHGWWLYFPIALVVKTPLPTLFLFFLGLWQKKNEKDYIYLILPIMLFLGGAMLSAVNIGLRHIILLYPLMFIIAAKGGRAAQRSSGQPFILLPIAIWYLFIALVVTPHQLSFFNLLAGGPSRGYHILLDSNYDWGQNDQFLREHVKKLEPGSYEINPCPFSISTGTLIVNANALHGIYGNGGMAAYQWLRPIKPTKRIAYTWFRYDLPEGYFHDHPDLKANPQWLPNRFRSYPPTLHRSERVRAWRTLHSYLASLRENFSTVRDQTYRYGLAWSFISVGAYGEALEEIRAMLKENPSSEELIGVGGELMVRWKLGILSFDGDDYLKGPVPKKVYVSSRLEVEEAAQAAQKVKLSNLFFSTHMALARALGKANRPYQAKICYRAAASFATKNRR